VLLGASLLEVIGLVVLPVAGLALALIGLLMNAKPKPGVRVRVDRDGSDPPIFGPGEEGDLSIYVELRPSFIGKPTAADTTITVNVEQSWALKRLTWSAPGKSESHEVAVGKGLKPRPWWAFRQRMPNTGPSYFLVAEHLWLIRDEPGERLKATLIASDKPGHYAGWIHASAEEGYLGVHVFSLQCVR
jgi:hypothetical protein